MDCLNINIVYSFMGIPVFSFSLSRGGDWIDEHAAMHTDETTAADPEYPNTDPPTEPSQPNGPSNGFVGISYSIQF